MDIQNLSPSQLSSLNDEELRGVTLKSIGLFFKENQVDYMGLIYSYTSLTTGMKYIGQTRNPIARNGTHISSSKPGTKRTDSKGSFYVAIRNEGFENFRYNVLKVIYSDDFKEYEELIDKYEQHYIDVYQTTDCAKGYNYASGGKNLPLGGTSYWARPVKQYSLYGEFIKSYECINDAARDLNINCSCISAACSLHSARQVAGGFLWTYSENNLPVEAIKRATRGVIHRYSISGEYIDSFIHYSVAADLVGGNRTRIMRCANPPCDHIAYGYRWSREKVSKLQSPPVKLSVEVHKYDKEGRYIASYDTQVDGAASIGKKSATHLSVCLTEHWRKAGGYYWRTFKKEKIDIVKK
ncbi:MAG: GIY-YIG nuclease family protein [Rikenellaceae bacterium]